MATITRFVIDVDAPNAQRTFDRIGARITELDRSLQRQREIGVSDKTAAAKLARTQLAADRLGDRLKSMPLTIDGAKKAEVQLLALEATADSLNKKLSGTGVRGATADMDGLADSAAGLGGKLGRLSNLAIPALVGGAVALSPVIATLGTGLGGLGLAALGVTKNARLMKAELAPAKAELAAFQKQLQPVVLDDFAAGLRIAGHLMADVRPVAQATGKALGGMLGAVDREFASGTWQRFFTWMAQQAGPDVRMLTTDTLQLVHALPGIIEALQPVATATLGTIGRVEELTGDISKLTSSIVTLNHVAPKSSTPEHSPLYWASDQGIIHGLKFINDLLPRFLQHAAEGAGLIKRTGDQAHAAGPGIASYGGAVYKTGQLAGLAGNKLETMAQAVTALDNAESKSLDAQLAYSNAIITSRNDAVSLRQALAASGKQIGLHTAAQRASFSAANQYISDLENTAKQSWASGHGTDGAIKAIQNGLPILESAKTHSRDYWQEVKTLVNWLHKLEQQKQIHDVVHLSGSGAWTFGLSGTGSYPSRHIKGHAAGTASAPPGWAWVGEKGPELMKFRGGETVIPNHALRGYADGTANYAGALAGLQPWGQKNWDATITAMTRAFVAAGKQIQASGAPGALGGPTSASAAQAQAYARSRLGAYGWGASQMLYLIPLWNQESGWNRFARNPSSGAYGIPQALPASKMGAAANPPTSSAAAQINWGLGYIAGRYGSPAGAWAHERSFNWYAKGTPGAAPGWAWVGERGPELVKFAGGEHVLDAITSRRLGGYAKGTDLARLGRELLHRPHHGVLDHEIAHLRARYHSDHLLATAPGLGPSRHSHYARLAKAERVHLDHLEHVLAAERAYRSQLNARVAVLKATQAAARREHLGGEAADLERRIRRHEAIIRNINLWTAGVASFHKAAKAAKPGPVSTAPTALTFSAYLAAISNYGSVPAYAKGTLRVPATGPAIVHEGETIFPADLANTIRGALRGGGGGDITVKVFIGDHELKDIIDVQISEDKRQIKRRAMAGSGRSR